MEVLGMDKKSEIPVKHPGIYLLDEITNHDMSRKELSIRTDVTEKHISTVINGVKNISPSFAKKLEYALGKPASYWLGLQAEYDSAVVQFEEENNITSEETNILKNLKDVIDYFLTHKIMHNDCGNPEKVIQLRSILGVSDLRSIPDIPYSAAYRAQIKDNIKVDPYVLFAWQRLCELKSKSFTSDNAFDPIGLKKCIPDIKQILLSHTDINHALKEIQSIFEKCGVIFLVVPNFRGAPVQGFIKKLDNGSALLCLTIRGKRADRFWFTLFHEIGHLVDGDLDTRFVDFDSVSDEMENNADFFARNCLIPDSEFKNFVFNAQFNKWNQIEQFAKRMGVPAFIVLGRLQKEEYLEWTDFPGKCPMYSWR